MIYSYFAIDVYLYQLFWYEPMCVGSRRYSTRTVPCIFIIHWVVYRLAIRRALNYDEKRKTKSWLNDGTTLQDRLERIRHARFWRWSLPSREAFSETAALWVTIAVEIRQNRQVCVQIVAFNFPRAIPFSHSGWQIGLATDFFIPVTYDSFSGNRFVGTSCLLSFANDL